MIERELERRELRRIIGGGVAVAAFAAALTPVPGADAVHTLWMAERFAAGDPAAALSGVFPPGLALAIAPFVALGLDPFRAGQLVTVTCVAVMLLCVARLTELTVPRGGLVGAALFAVLPSIVQSAARVDAQAPFQALAALAFAASLRGRPIVAGLAAAAAAWFRPEAIGLAILFVVAQPRRGWGSALLLAAGVASLAAWRQVLGHGFEPWPKLAMHFAAGETAWSAAGLDVRQLGANLVALPSAWLGAFHGFGLLAAAGLWRARRSMGLRGVMLLTLATLAVVALQIVRPRHLVALAFALAPCAVLALRALPERGRFPVLLVVLLTGLLSSLQIGPTDRISEREIGDYLRTELEAGERVTGDLPRCVWFAGSRPPPPGAVDAAELIERAQAADVRYVVLGARRPTAEVVAASLTGELGYRRAVLPEHERRAATLRGIAVYVRR